MFLTTYEEIIRRISESSSPQDDKGIMESVGVLLSRFAENRWRPLTPNSRLSPLAVQRMEIAISGAGHHLDADNVLYGTMTWATQWWRVLYSDQVVYPTPPSGKLIPADLFEEMLASGALVEISSRFFKNSEGELLVIVTMPDGSGLQRELEDPEDLIERVLVQNRPDSNDPFEVLLHRGLIALAPHVYDQRAAHILPDIYLTSAGEEALRKRDGLPLSHLIYLQEVEDESFDECDNDL